jgi:AraC-like DNA-binding protein
MDIVDPNSLPLDHPALVPDLWIRAMLSHPLVTPQIYRQALATAQLPMTEGENSYLFVTQNHEALLVATLAQSLAHGSFGAEAGLLIDPKHGSVLTYLLLAAKNSHDLLTLLGRYSTITRINSTVQFEITPTGASVSIASSNPVVYSNPQYIEFAISTVICMLRSATGREIHAQEIRFVHENPTPDANLPNVYRCPVAYGARRNQVIFSLDTLDLEVVSSDARLLQHLRSYGNILLQNRQPGQSGIRNRIEEVVLEHLTFGVPTVIEVAQRLGVSSRTLTRRLTNQGTSFRKIVDRLRHDLALHHLADPKLTLADIAYLLGYSDQSSFGVAFRKMSGKTPLQVRTMLGFSLVDQSAR